MPDDNGIESKAKQFFDKADEAAARYNFDYAIDLYLQGLRISPDSLQDGHLRLRELALTRQSKGGKKPTIMERMRFSGGKTPLDQMLNAEYLMARDPEHLPYIEAMLKAAAAGGYNQTTKWIADLLFATINASGNPTAHLYILLKDSYAAIGLWDRAIAACQYAARLRPDDDELADEARRLSAELTVSRGKYDQAGDFRKSIKNREEQEVLQSQQGVVKTKDYRVLAMEAAKKEYLKNPESAHNIFTLAGTLADMRTDQAEEEAIKLLEEGYKKRQDFSFKEKAGLVRIGQIKRKIREADEIMDANPEDSVAKSKHAGLIGQLNKAEMEHYGLCVKNYPTDLRVKYEYGLRLIQNQRYDEAIPMLQEAQKDPRHRISAMGKIGICFFMKGWFTDAEEIFVRAIETYEIKDDDIAKELRYNLGRSLEEQGRRAEALDIYRKIAQIDFGFKDVSQRVDRLRKEAK
jgi:tetratricopeptide (TPR) repeat protein